MLLQNLTFVKNNYYYCFMNTVIFEEPLMTVIMYSIARNLPVLRKFLAHLDARDINLILENNVIQPLVEFLKTFS